jgi:HSP20 family protein
MTSFGEPAYGFSSPWNMFRRMQEDMDRMWGQFFSGQGFGQPGGAQGGFPNVDMHETENEIIVRADVPGVEPEDLELFHADDRLIIRGECRRQEESKDQDWIRSERRYGRFERALPLPSEVRADQIQASFRNGVLELRLPKSPEAQQRMRRIPIQGGQTLAGAKGGEVTSTAEPPNAQQATGGTAPKTQKPSG